MYLNISKGDDIIQRIKSVGLKSSLAFRPVVLLLQSGPLRIIDSQVGIMVLLRAGSETQEARVRIHSREQDDVALISWSIGSILMVYGNAAVQSSDILDLLLIPVCVQTAETTETTADSGP